MRLRAFNRFGARHAGTDRSPEADPAGRGTERTLKRLDPGPGLDASDLPGTGGTDMRLEFLKLRGS